ncbi:MAG TPA: hypothetical protein VF432_23235 [Thermoanaerobaculia bacterium]
MRHSVAPACLMLLLACSPALAQPGHADRVENYLADVVVRTDGDRVTVLLDTIVDAGTAPDGIVDQWFVLQTAEPVLTPVMVHLPQALVVHQPRALRISTSDQRYELLIDRPKTPDAAMTTRIAGIGLSHNTGTKGPRLGDQLDRRGRVVTTCDWCLTQDPGPGGGSGSGSTSCPSGGPGATQCSASYGTNSCSVSCASGYYACCQALPGSAYCRCIKG